MPNTKDLKVESRRWFGLIYGGSGAGKTHLVGTFPNPYIFDFDIAVEEMAAFEGKNIEYDFYGDVLRNEVLVESGAQKFEEKLNEFDKECPFDTLVIDSLSAMQDSKLKELSSVNNRRDKAGRLVASQNEYGLLIFWIKELLRTLPVRYPTKHIIITAHEHTMNDAITGEVKIRPLVYGQKLPGELPRYFSEMYRLDVIGVGDKVRRIIHTVASTTFEAKSRLQISLKDKDANFENIMNARKEKEVSDG